MKKLIITALMFAARVVFVPEISARSVSAGAAAVDPQIPVQIVRYQPRRYNRRYYPRARTVVTTRTRRIGPWVFRETIRTTYLPNGMTRTVVIRRQRLYRWRRY